MNVRIARDGVEIGECDWEDLEQLVNEGQVLATDHYWYEGMPDWRLLEHLIGLAESEPAAPQPPSDWETGEFAAPPPRPVDWDSVDPATLAPVFRNSGGVTIIIGCAVIVSVAVVSYLIATIHNRHSVEPNSIVDATLDRERSDPAFRARAIAELDQKLKRLPRVASPPANTFYYGLTVTIPPAPARLSARIVGAEDVMDSTTTKTILHKPFVLTVEYLQGEWVFKNYRISRIDMTEGVLNEVEEDTRNSVPPSIVYIMGLKAKIH